MLWGHTLDATLVELGQHRRYIAVCADIYIALAIALKNYRSEIRLFKKKLNNR